MAFPLAEVKYAVHIPDAEPEKHKKLDSFLVKVQRDVWGSVQSLSHADQQILRGALIFAAVAAAESTTDQGLEDVISDFREVAGSHEAVHGEPMSKFIKKYYSH